VSQQLTAKQQYWSDILASADDSGLSLAEFARANQLTAQELYRWRNQLKKYHNRDSQPETRFTQIVATQYSSVSALSIQIGDVRLQFGELPNPDWLARVLVQQRKSL